ncbi:MAG TPA: nucleotide sugar dehydrogenase [Candidatus Dormibacteraeota bacterium]|nr:nucleotide sugar dehydrogenase [Candidatus Dormibacteraeota bacterium]
MSESVAVVGLGRVGLPFALFLAQRGCTVYGVENNPDTVSALRAGRMPFRESGGPEALAATLGTRFHPGDDLAAIRQADTIVITLGTPVDDFNNPVFLPIENLLKAALPHLRPGQLLVLRSTVAPGATEQLGRLIERKGGLRIGTDLFLAFCPERIAEGHSFTELPEVPQIVGGVDAASGERAARFFRLVTPTVHQIDARSAELAKLFCNMYRYIDFAVGNEFMMIAAQHGREIYPILEAVNRGYKRGGIKSPGLTGGPCLYKDGFFLTGKIPYNELIASAWKIHETTPAYLVEQARARAPLDGAKAAILGLAFKKDIDDPRNSLAYKLRKILLAEGAEVHLHDPLIPSAPLDAVLAGAQFVFLAMNHDAFRALSVESLRRQCAPGAVVADVWNVLGTGTVVFSLTDA